jgi:hypothetical protein
MRKLLFENQDAVEAEYAEVVEWYRSKLPGYEVQESTGRIVFAYQGGWWYRGETTVQPVAKGTQITVQIYNVATYLGWAVPLANKFFIGAKLQYAKAFTDTLAQLRADLGLSPRY